MYETIKINYVKVILSPYEQDILSRNQNKEFYLFIK